MLRLHSGPVLAAPVPLPGGAVWRLRPATSFEVDQAAAEATRILAGLVSAEECAEEAALILGEEFRAADFTEPKWQVAAAEQIAVIELATLCTDGWSGILFGDGNDAVEIKQPERAHIAVALRDPTIGDRIKKMLYAGFHQEQAEKNG